MGKRTVLLYIFIYTLFISFSLVYAQENISQSPVVSEEDSFSGETDVNDETGIDEELEKEFGSDVKLENEAGTTPDSTFYFIDEFFDRFGNPVDVREEKIAEVRAMIESGNEEGAREALERYRKYTENPEKIDPKKREDARRSSAAIRKIAREEFGEEFKKEILEREENLVTAVEIASKIKELCLELNKLSPDEFYRTCRTDDDSPRWQKDLFDSLTEEQEKEAREFFGVMKNCFKNPRTCKCDDIKIQEFADKCRIAAPLSIQCDLEDNEEACNKLDDVTEDIKDTLPPHLLRVLDAIEEEFESAKFEHHIPRECKEAGAEDRKSCMMVMVRINAPPECVEALENGKIELKSDRQFREACEKIMFEVHAPKECIEEGVREPKECSKLMFKLHAPQECIDAGLTGESRGDEQKCRLIMESKGRGPAGEGPPALGIRCRQIKNPEERLKCYDSALSGVNKFDNSGPGNFEDRASGEHDWPEPCRVVGAFSRDECERIIGEFRQDDGFDDEFRDEERAKEFSSSMENNQQIEGSTVSGFGEGEGSLDRSEPGIEGGTITGGVIAEDNKFLKYFYRFLR